MTGTTTTTPGFALSWVDEADLPPLEDADHL